MAAAAPQPAAPLAVEEVVVTGSRLRVTGFTTPTPVTVINSSDIASKAGGDLSAVIQDQPAVASASGAVGGPRQANNAGQNWINLRGLGENRTLTLIDGRRVTGSSAQGPFDINMIPTNLVERIEFVTGGASAAYGSDAVAGVANIILKSHWNGFKANIQYGVSQRGDDGEVAGGFALGKTVMDGRLHILVGFDASDSKGIGSWYSRKFGRAEPGLISFGLTRPAGVPSQGFLTGAELATFAPGGLITAGPLKGTAFNPDGSTFSFPTTNVFGANMYGTTANYGDGPNSFFNVATPYSREAGLFRVVYDIDNNTKATFEAGGGHVHSTNLANVLNTSTIVSINDPYLPAATRAAAIAAGVNSSTGTLTIGRTNSDLGAYRARNHDYNIRLLADLSGKVFGDWQWDAFVEHSQSDLHGYLTGYRTADVQAAFYAVTGPNGQPACGDVASNPNLTATTRAQVTSGCVPFNIFGSNNSSAAAKAYLKQFTQGFLTSMKQDIISASVNGQPFNDWAGPVSVSAGLEYRRDAMDQSRQADSVALGPTFATGNFAAFNAKRNDKEAFVETNVPLLRGAPLVKALDLNAAYRYTDYSDSGTVSTWKVGATYDLNDEYRFRITRSHDIRAPDLFAQYGTGATSLFPFSNPFTGTTDTPTFQKGANPNLTPEISNTTTAGFVARPHWIPGLSLSFDYFTIQIDGYLAALFPQDLANGCFRGVTLYCNQLTFDANKHVTFVTQQLLNIAKLKTNGFDFEADYRLPVQIFDGDLSVRAMVTRTYHMTLFDVNGIPTESAGTYTQPKWKTQVNLTYSRGPFSTTASVRGFNSIKYSNTLIGPDAPNYSPSLTNSINKNKFPSAAYLNLAFSYQFPSQGIQVYSTINNVFNTQQPVLAAAAFVGGATPRETYDLVGRAFKLGVRLTY